MTVLTAPLLSPTRRLWGSTSPGHEHVGLSSRKYASRHDAPSLLGRVLMTDHVSVVLFHHGTTQSCGKMHTLATHQGRWGMDILSPTCYLTVTFEDTRHGICRDFVYLPGFVGTATNVQSSILDSLKQTGVSLIPRSYPVLSGITRS